MFQTARFVGSVVREVISSTAQEGQKAESYFNASFILGGQIKGSEPRLFMIYPEGNFIEAGGDTPFFQIGETKYGKPILDRALKYETPIEEVVKVGLISFDSTLRSNLAVGRPLDLVVVPADPAQPTIQRRVGIDDPYFNDLSTRWSMLLNESMATIPDPPFMMGAD